MYIDSIFLNRKMVESKKDEKKVTYFFADFKFGNDVFSVFLPSSDVYMQLDNVSLGDTVSLVFEPRIFNNKLQFNLIKIEVD